MTRKRIDQIDGITQMFATTSLLMNYVYEITENLDEPTRAIVIDYLKLRASTTWNKSEVQTLITLARYEITCQKLTSQLEEANKEDILNVKKVKEITNLLGNVLNQAQQLRLNLGLTLSALHGIARDRREADQAQGAVVDILTPKQLKNNEVATLDQMRASAKTKLLKVAS
jgi:hypothetical protein